MTWLGRREQVEMKAVGTAVMVVAAMWLVPAMMFSFARLVGGRPNPEVPTVSDYYGRTGEWYLARWKVALLLPATLLLLGYLAQR